MRKATGLWLAEHANPCDKVHSEPIGYIGFYSGLHILDWPGLQSPEVVVLRHRFNNDRAKVLQELMPDWIVLRPMEMLYINQQVELNQTYEIAVVFDQTGKLDELSWLPGNRYHYADAKYFVLRKIRDDAGRPVSKPVDQCAAQEPGQDHRQDGEKARDAGLRRASRGRNNFV